MSYELLKHKQGSVFNILQYHFQNVFKSVLRRISFRERYRNPWRIEISESLHWSLFYEWFKAIQDHNIHFGRSLEIEKDKKKIVKKYVIKFFHLGTFKYHCKQILEEDPVLKKKNKVTGATAKVVVADDKPAVIIYDIKKGQMIMKMRYQVTNKYDTVCSF